MHYNLAVIGSGPAGLSAAVQASSEGLSTVVVDAAHVLGGQAGSSSLIENYLGFHEGISGSELMKNAITQASKFGTEFRAPFNVTCLNQIDDKWEMCSDDEYKITTDTVLLAMGVTYRLLQAKNISRFIGCGVVYGSPSLSESYCHKTVTVVGGANSAGQAAVHLSNCGDCRVNLLVRGDSLEKSMSTYLIDKIRNNPNITVMLNTHIIEAAGKSHELDTILVEQEGVIKEIKTDKVFILIGAKPKTAWVKNTLPLDEKGFILTGGACGSSNLLSMESITGIFAAGDIRSKSVKRVSSAVGEGARAVSDIHSYLTKFK